MDSHHILCSWVPRRLIEDLGGVHRYLDLGCSDGHLTIKVARIIGAEEVYGVDVDDATLRDAEERGLKTVKADLSLDELPFGDNYQSEKRTRLDPDQPCFM